MQRRPTLNWVCHFTPLYIPTLKFIPAMRNMLCTKGMHCTLRLCALNIQYILWEKRNLSEARTWKEFYSGLLPRGNSLSVKLFYYAWASGSEDLVFILNVTRKTTLFILNCYIGIRTDTACPRDLEICNKSKFELFYRGCNCKTLRVQRNSTNGSQSL